jgi:2-iminobutanoate/2-iminopropanoate deaminase
MKQLFLIVFLLGLHLLSTGQDKNVPKPIAPYSPAVLAGETLYLSGQIPINPETGQMITGDIKEQTKQVMDNLGAILKKFGYDYSDLVKCTVFMTNMDNYAAINDTYGSFFKDKFPAREAVQVVRLPKGAEVEISGIAVKKQTGKE